MSAAAPGAASRGASPAAEGAVIDPSDRPGVRPDAPPLRARELVRTFGPQRAVDGVSFELPAGRFLSLFGPNGAGKTTLLRLLSGALRPTAGALLLGDEPLRTREPGWQRRIGVLSHQTFLYGNLTARENLRFFGDLYGLDDLEARIDAGLEAVDLARRADDLARTYSRGMRQRLALARTLLHDPEVVLLDEPFTGLDAHASGVLRDVLEALRDGRRTVIMVTHNLAEGLAMADACTIQVRGRLAWWGPADAVPGPDFPAFYRDTVDGHG